MFEQKYLKNQSYNHLRHHPHHVDFHRRRRQQLQDIQH
jgi:hypothetical protein